MKPKSAEETRDLVAKALDHHRMIPPGGRVFVAHSGGADSTALLQLLHEIAPTRGFSLEVIHVHHGLRGEEAEADARFSQGLAQLLGVPFHLERLVRAAGSQGNVEESLRQARHEIFARYRCREDDRTALGHTRDDQAETFFLRLFRGAGGEGLSAMAPVAGPLVRPLLGISRDRVLNFLVDRGLPHREDASNADLRFTRNRLRREVLPVIERAFPAAKRQAARSAGILRQEHALLRRLLSERVAPILHREGPTIWLETDPLLGFPEWARPAVLREAIRAVRGDLRRLEAVHLEQALAFIARASGGKRLKLPGLSLFKSRGRVIFGAVPPPPPAFLHVLPLPGRLQVPETGERFQASYDPIEAGPAEKGAPAVVLARLPEPADGLLVVRNWRPGDALRQSAGRRKLKKIFQESRVPVEERSRLSLLCDSRGHILWIPELGREVCYNDANVRSIFLAREK